MTHSHSVTKTVTVSHTVRRTLRSVVEADRRKWVRRLSATMAGNPTKKPLPNPKTARKLTKKLWSTLDTGLRVN